MLAYPHPPLDALSLFSQTLLSIYNLYNQSIFRVFTGINNQANIHPAIEELLHRPVRPDTSARGLIAETRSIDHPSQQRIPRVPR